MIGNLSHVTIAVPDLETAINQYENIFGAFVSAPQDFPDHGVRLAVVKLSNTTLELATPLGNFSPLEDFLKNNPHGAIHHLCYEVLDLAKARDTLAAAGLLVMGDGGLTTGYRGNPVLSFHPKDCLGVPIELVEIGASKTQKKDLDRPIGPVRTPSQEDADSFRGTGSISLAFEIDFKNKTPADKGERE